MMIIKFVKDNNIIDYIEIYHLLSKHVVYFLSKFYCFEQVILSQLWRAGC